MKGGKQKGISQTKRSQELRDPSFLSPPLSLPPFIPPSLPPFLPSLTHIHGHIFERVYMNGQGKLQFVQDITGGGDGVHGGAEDGGVGVVPPNVPRKGSLGGREWRRGEDVPRLGEVYWLEHWIVLGGREVVKDATIFNSLPSLFTYSSHH